MKYTFHTAEELAKKLRELPPADISKRRMTKQAIIRHLAAEIAAMQERGHTLEQVAECLCGFGLTITTPTLKSYLQRTRKRQRKHSRKTRSSTVSRAPETEKTADSEARPTTRTVPRGSPSTTQGGTQAEFIAKDRERL